MPAVWLRAVALGRSVARTIAGTRAASTGWATARPEASSATRPTTSNGCPVYASARQIADWAVPAPTSSARLSTRSASRPVSGASATSGRVAANSMPATALPPAPEVCRLSVRVVAVRNCPQVANPRAEVARATSAHRDSPDMKDILRK